MEKLIGEMIRDYRKANGMSQTEIAKLLGMERKTLWRIENNINAVNSDIIYKLCDIFDCSPNELFGFKV